METVVFPTQELAGLGAGLNALRKSLAEDGAALAGEAFIPYPEFDPPSDPILAAGLSVKGAMETAKELKKAVATAKAQIVTLTADRDAERAGGDAALTSAKRMRAKLLKTGRYVTCTDCKGATVDADGKPCAKCEDGLTEKK